ncbi:penicillin-binding protein 2B [Oceanobacillus limi]|uniref:serine-type D-Ala-D-Ala carboxypeptidase n=1 Tax=Oceanobacillus limi TaxID=930131 RepID=A0A1I0DE21_9BACI|nr:penicillin-binding protein [Oceanobacillus limi]SET30265.1 penicillin-binding protein 2B [Oceanobacillus limi]
MKKNQTTHFMTGIFIIFFVAIFLILTGRFIYIQASGEVQNVSLEEWAIEKRTSSYTLESERGKIFDNNGMTLAYDMPTYRMYAIVDPAFSENLESPKHVDDPVSAANKLAPLLDVDEKYILDQINKGIDTQRTQVEFGNAGRALSQSEMEAIDDLNIPGINFYRESSRYYPNGMFASHIIGFARDEEVETEDGAIVRQVKGIAGIENEMNDLLGGKDGYISYQRDLYNKKLLDPNEVIQEPENGDNVYLTIDQKVQTLLEDVMSQVEDKYSPERITAIVMNPKTGEIVAMGNRPSYNPNNPSNVENWYNDAISTPFELGSTMKMFTWAAAIEEGVYNGSEGFKSGSYKINDRVKAINDHNYGKGWGTISYDEGFARSSNVAASKLVWEKIGPDSFLEYLEDFHFDQLSGIDLPGEVGGQILYNWPAEKLTTSFGQGSTATPIQLMKAATAIANDGQMVQPYTIKQIVDSTTGKLLEENETKVVGNPISKETAQQVKELLVSVVQSEHGTGSRFNLRDYSVAGKTGTAEIPNPEGGGYLTGTGNNVYSFLGMAPADDPELMMYVSVKQPDLETENGIESGSSPVSFIFNHVMENSLHYLDIEPDKDDSTDLQQIEIPDLIGKKVSVLREDLISKGITVNVVGEGGQVSASNVKTGESILPNERVILVTNEPTMPDVTGWSMREVLKLAGLLGIELDISGHGYVYKQNIDEGSSISQDDKLHVELIPPTEIGEAEESDDEEE